MKTLKAIMAVAMIMILASCGGKSFDYDKADKLCDKYEDDGFDDKDWEEFASLYEDLIDYNIKVSEKLMNDIKPGMDMEDVEDLAEKDPEMKKVNKAYSDMIHIIMSVDRDDVPKDAVKKIEKADKKAEKEGKRIMKEINKKIKE